MKAYLLPQIYDLNKNENPLIYADVEQPRPTSNDILIKVSVCGICHTELDEIEGRTPPASFPMIPGHQVIGRIIENGPDARRFAIGTRVGVAWIFSACGKCSYCLSNQENLCPQFRATGRDANGGYAEYMTVDENFAYLIPEIFTDAEAAPLLCAGAIGYRSLRLTNLHNGQKLGLTGFGASAHLVLKMVRHRFPQTPVYVFARSKNEQAFARELGAVWAGDTNEPASELLDAIIDTTPVWTPIVAALKNLKPGGHLVINAIRKENSDKSILTTIDYPEHLWLEKEIKSVANVTRRDVAEFLELAAEIPIKPEVEIYPFEKANQALLDLKQRHVRGAKVLQIS
ncbi:MAG TPA: zinc-dependent alcohol dehydrogenase family protein [Candidatus Marinimicrobia bacterium]|nr:zinc-dependent alcohol dehydrogenase family protein [Candidatus Neomarinimicrobiota bacterium]